MSAKNSAEAKKARRAERQSRQLKFNPAKQNNTQFHLIPSLQSENSGTRYYGNCQSCLFSGHVKDLSNGEVNLLLKHEHSLEFLDQEQLDAIEESAKLYYEKYLADKEEAEEGLE